MNNIAFYLSLLTFALAFALYRGEDEMKCDGQVAEDAYENAESLLYLFCGYDVSDPKEKCYTQSIFDFVISKIATKYDDIESMKDALCSDGLFKDEDKTAIETACTIAVDVKEITINKVIDPNDDCLKI